MRIEPLEIAKPKLKEWCTKNISVSDLPDSPGAYDSFFGDIFADIDSWSTLSVLGQYHRYFTAPTNFINLLMKLQILDEEGADFILRTTKPSRPGTITRQRALKNVEDVFDRYEYNKGKIDDEGLSGAMEL